MSFPAGPCTLTAISPWIELGLLSCRWSTAGWPRQQENIDMNFVAFILAILGFVALLLPGISGLSSLLG